MEQNRQRLDQDFYQGTPRQVAKRLLGKLLVRRLESGQRISGIVVEVEAYLAAGDPASHSFRGESRKNAAMFLPAGALYVYSIHARHCLNVVTEPAGVGSAVLIRAVEPFEGKQLCAVHRGQPLPIQAAGQPPTSWLRSLTTGPGRLCQAFQVNRELDGISLIDGEAIWLEDAPECVLARRWQSKASPRIGITQARDRPLRWFSDGHQLVSGCAAEHTRGRTWRFLP